MLGQLSSLAVSFLNNISQVHVSTEQGDLHRGAS